MLAYVVRRLLVTVPLLLLTTIVVFLVVSASGDPLSETRFNLLQRNDPEVAERLIAAEERRLNLDQPLPERYVSWIGGIVTEGDFGPSRTLPLPIGQTLVDRSWVTLQLVVPAVLLALLLAVLVGVVSAVRQYSLVDYAATFVGFLLLSMPIFWVAVLLKEFLAIRVNRALGRTVLYTIGDRSPGIQTAPLWDQFTNYLGHLVLPVIVLAMSSYAAWSRYQRASMLEVLDSDYVRLARAKGLRSRTVLRRHALRTALIPLTTVVAVEFGALLSGTIVTETVFSRPGLGRLLLEAVAARDVNVVLAWLLVAGVAVVLLNLLADILYAVLDPRIRYD